mmetsp:Transcript_33050/g.103918  ORF Transcript_33050/g.103918 Transcript_33050/m.103918 type:complete len:247 (+) Transcript_33050:59-799(+)
MRTLRPALTALLSLVLPSPRRFLRRAGSRGADSRCWRRRSRRQGCLRAVASSSGRCAAARPSQAVGRRRWPCAATLRSGSSRTRDGRVSPSWRGPSPRRSLLATSRLRRRTPSGCSTASARSACLPRPGLSPQPSVRAGTAGRAARRPRAGCSRRCAACGCAGGGRRRCCRRARKATLTSTSDGTGGLSRPAARASGSTLGLLSRWLAQRGPSTRWSRSTLLRAGGAAMPWRCWRPWRRRASSRTR